MVLAYVKMSFLHASILHNILFKTNFFFLFKKHMPVIYVVEVQFIFFIKF